MKETTVKFITENFPKYNIDETEHSLKITVTGSYFLKLIFKSNYVIIDRHFTGIIQSIFFKERIQRLINLEEKLVDFFNKHNFEYRIVLESTQLDDLTGYLKESINPSEGHYH